MTKDDIVARIDKLLELCNRPLDQRPEPEMIFNGTLTLMTAAYGGESHQVRTLLKRRDEVAKDARTDRERKFQIIVSSKGALENLRDEVEGGLLTSVERRITSDVLSDLIQLARVALGEGGDGAKNVAAVLAAAAYEDTLRRVAREHAGVIGQDKLEAVIGKLKDADLLVAPQLGIAIGYLSFRNHALHAQWETIDRAAVQSVLGFVEELLLKHFS